MIEHFTLRTLNRTLRFVETQMPETEREMKLPTKLVIPIMYYSEKNSNPHEKTDCSRCCSVARLCLTLCDPTDVAHQTSLSFTISWRLLKLMSIELVMPSNYQYPLLLLPSVFPASGSFPVNWLFTSGGKSIEVSVSASVLPMNDQGWFPLGFTGLIFLMSKGLSRVFSSTTVQKHQLFSAQPHLCFHIHTWLLEKS